MSGVAYTCDDGLGMMQAEVVMGEMEYTANGVRWKVKNAEGRGRA